MNVAATEKICAILSDVLRSSETTVNEGGNFFRVRKMIDIFVPLSLEVV